MAAPTPSRVEGRDFIRAIIEDDLASGRHARIHTRFPPEPNGFLHIGHVKSICLNFGVAEEYGGLCNLRFDDTNPSTEDVAFVEAIQEDIRWLGFDWEDRLYHASGWFEELYRLAERLIEKGLAYVDSQSEEEIREHRGTVTEPGRPSPYRDRSVEENLDLFRRMRAGEFEDGAHVLRAKIDMGARNMLMRDPLLYRIRHAHHYRTGDAWCIYPLYDFAHPLSDALEDITHSLCTLEFENNRELYDWLVRETEVPATPRQIEFARLELEYTVLSKRRMLRLVNEGHVSGWDDPRMPSIAGMRRRGVTPTALRAFVDMVGVAKANSIVDIGKLEFAIRDDLNPVAPRLLCVLRPLKVVLTDWPDGKTETLDAPFYPRDVARQGSRPLPFSGELLIERDDFMEDPPGDFHRLAPGREVRLRHAYVIRCDEVVKDPATGEVTELRCSHDPDSLGGSSAGRRVKGTIHWVSAPHALPCEVRLYDRLFSVADPGDAPEGEDFLRNLNPESLVVVPDARVEPGVRDFPPDTRVQFERAGYFWQDPVDSAPDRLVFNRIVALRDAWAERLPGVAPRAIGEAEEVGVGIGRGTAAASGSEPARRPMTRDRVRSELSAHDPAAAARFTRYHDELGLGVEDARTVALDPGFAELFEEALHADAPAGPVANWIINELPRELEKQDASNLPFGGVELGALVSLVEDGTLSQTAARRVLSRLAREGGDPRAIVEREGLTRLGARGELEPVVTAVLEAHPEEAARYRAGEVRLAGFFTGEVMKRTRGRADPRVVQEILRRELG